MEISYAKSYRSPFLYQPFFCESSQLVEDARGKQGKQYSFSTLSMCIALCALAGKERQRQMAIFLNEQWDSISSFLKTLNPGSKVPKQSPSQSTISRFMCFQNYGGLQNHFLMKVREDLNNEHHGLQILSFDGKSRANCFNSETGRFDMDIHLFNSTKKMLLAVMTCSVGEGEATTAAKLMNKIQLYEMNTIVTADAAYYSSAFWDSVTDSNLEYVLAIKGNSKGLFKSLSSFPWKSKFQYFSKEQKRGRNERRLYKYMKLEDMPEEVDLASIEIPNLGGFVKTVSYSEKGGKKTEVVRYFAVSLGFKGEDIKDIAFAIRSHWNIENCLHWVKDKVLGEDSHPRQSLNSSRMLSVMKNLTHGIGMRACGSVQTFIDIVASKPDKWFLKFSQEVGI